MRHRENNDRTRLRDVFTDMPWWSWPAIVVLGLIGWPVLALTRAGSALAGWCGDHDLMP